MRIAVAKRERSRRKENYISHRVRRYAKSFMPSSNHHLSPVYNDLQAIVGL